MVRHKVTRKVKGGKTVTFYRGHGTKMSEIPSKGKEKPVIASSSHSISTLVDKYLYDEGNPENDALLESLLGPLNFDKLENMVKDSRVPESAIINFVKSVHGLKAKKSSEGGGLKKESTKPANTSQAFEVGTPAVYKEYSGEIVMRDGKKMLKLYNDKNYSGRHERIIEPDWGSVKTFRQANSENRTSEKTKIPPKGVYTNIERDAAKWIALKRNSKTGNTLAAYEKRAFRFHGKKALMAKVKELQDAES